MNNELKILERVIKEERLAQSLFFDSHSAWANAICIRYLSNSQIAEEALQDGFVKIFKSLRNYDPSKAALRTWMSKIIVRTCLDKLRLKSEKWHAEHLNIDKVDTEIDYDEYSDSELFALIERMPKGYRVVFNLYLIEGYDHKEISRMLGIKSTTSRSQFHRGKKWLKKQLQQLQVI